MSKLVSKLRGNVMDKRCIDEMHPRDKPCYIVDQGVYRGAYMRA